MDWTTLLNSLLEIILPALGSLLVVWFGILGTKIKNTYDNKVNTETKKEMINLSVKYVEQVYKTLHGEDKLRKAIEQATLLLNEKGISVSEVELKTLIESAVYGLKQGVLEDSTIESPQIENETELKEEA